MQKRDTITAAARPQSSSAYHVVGHTSRSAETVECSIPLLMHKGLRIIQLNVHKRDTVQLSLMNDNEFQCGGNIRTTRADYRKHGGDEPYGTP